MESRKIEREASELRLLIDRPWNISTFVGRILRAFGKVSIDTQDISSRVLEMSENPHFTARCT